MNYENAPQISYRQYLTTAGPVSVALNADFFQQYAGGIFDEPYCSDEPNHGVLVVGYGEEAGRPYWLVKNSWGRIWGEEGYIRMARNNGNECGIANDATYPILR